jgi:hypothetical protein
MARSACFMRVSACSRTILFNDVVERAALRLVCLHEGHHPARFGVREKSLESSHAALEFTVVREFGGEWQLIARRCSRESISTIACRVGRSLSCARVSRSVVWGSPLQPSRLGRSIATRSKR